MLDMSKVSVNNSRVSVMLLWTVTFKLCRCVTIYKIKNDIAIQYQYIISSQNPYDYWNFSIDETPNF